MKFKKINCLALYFSKNVFSEVDETWSDGYWKFNFVLNAIILNDIQIGNTCDVSNLTM